MYTNTSVDINRFTDIGGEKSYTSLVTSIAVYIEPIDEDIALTIDGQASYETFRMLSSYTDVQIGDQIVEGDTKYKIRGKRVFNSLVGSHVECILQSRYED